jgi:hypothetical protein
MESRWTSSRRSLAPDVEVLGVMAARRVEKSLVALIGSLGRREDRSQFRASEEIMSVTGQVAKSPRVPAYVPFSFFSRRDKVWVAT